MSKPGFPVWWDTTITVYNKYIDPQTQLVTWFRNVVADCFWKLDGSMVQVGDVTLDSKSIICRIPKDDRFLEKQEWINLPNDEMGNYFTLAPDDILVKGVCSFEVDEYTSGHRSTDLLGKYREYQACMAITEFSNNTGIGRNEKHYFVRGK